MGRGGAGCPQHPSPRTTPASPGSLLAFGLSSVSTALTAVSSGACAALGVPVTATTLGLGFVSPSFLPKFLLFMCNMSSLQSFPLKLEKPVPSTFTSCLPARIPGGCEGRAKVCLGSVMMRTGLRGLPWLVPARGQGWRARAACLDL